MQVLKICTSAGPQTHVPPSAGPQFDGQRAPPLERWIVVTACRTQLPLVSFPSSGRDLAESEYLAGTIDRGVSLLKW